MINRLNLIILLLCVLLFGCESTEESENTRREYPLSQQQVVIESSRPVVQLFEECRSMLLDSYTNIADKLSTNSLSTMIAVKINSSIGKKQMLLGAYMNYTIILEFKENKIRLTFKDILIHTFNGYGQHFINTPNEMPRWFNPTWKEASMDYIGDYKRIYNKVKAITDGAYESDW